VQQPGPGISIPIVGGKEPIEFAARMNAMIRPGLAPGGQGPAERSAPATAQRGTGRFMMISSLIMLTNS